MIIDRQKTFGAAFCNAIYAVFSVRFDTVLTPLDGRSVTISCPPPLRVSLRSPRAVSSEPRALSSTQTGVFTALGFCRVIT
ncbi:hypothetical protein B0G82_5995 [Paraburkholderia sp. BL17N1]|nr:hypothetical protein B0G82_5995 [Paraburkholderia sp. BL17N1]